MKGTYLDELEESGLLVVAICTGIEGQMGHSVNLGAVQTARLHQIRNVIPQAAWK
jgi:hypothetical protein